MYSISSFFLAIPLAKIIFLLIFKEGLPLEFTFLSL